ncbi:MAG: metal-dependent hydrolase [Bdellovibrionales bacterium]|nr:metal-dependent hydrolase [Bdellovibrionales bacterium]
MNVRKFHLNTNRELQLNWLPQRPFLGLWFLSYALHVADAESFIIRTCGQTLSSTTPWALKKRLHLCFGQEAQHAISHEKIYKKAVHQLNWLKGYLFVHRWICYKALPLILNQKILLVVAASLEQMNTKISLWSLEQNSLSQATDSEMRNLMEWHFYEEVEHREVVFDLLERENIPKWQLIVGSSITALNFFFWTTMTAFFMAVTQKIELKGIGLGKLFTLLIQSSFKLCKKDYHPSHEDIRIIDIYYGSNYRNSSVTQPLCRTT